MGACVTAVISSNQARFPLFEVFAIGTAWMPLGVANRRDEPRPQTPPNVRYFLSRLKSQGHEDALAALAQLLLAACAPSRPSHRQFATPSDPSSHTLAAYESSAQEASLASGTEAEGARRLAWRAPERLACLRHTPGLIVPFQAPCHAPFADARGSPLLFVPTGRDRDSRAARFFLFAAAAAMGATHQRSTGYRAGTRVEPGSQGQHGNRTLLNVAMYSIGAQLPNLGGERAQWCPTPLLVPGVPLRTPRPSRSTSVLPARMSQHGRPH